MKVLLAAVAGLVVMGCNSGQPRIYKVAIDPSQLGALPPSCYVNNQLPDNEIRTSIQNLRVEQEWTIWDGLEGAQYLDMGNQVQFGLGDALPVTVDTLIEGKDNVFSGTETQTELPSASNNNHSSVRTRTVTVNLENQGTTPNGTIDVVSNYTCTNCYQNETEMVNNKSCATRLNFVAHRVDTQRISVNE